MAAVIYLNWTATGYDWIRPGHYHSIIGGDGRVHRLHAYSVDLPAHTYGRNRNSVALSCACMGGSPDPWTLPPTAAQLDSLCAETASVARSWGWGADAISIQSVMTHAEAASNRDGRARRAAPPAAVTSCASGFAPCWRVIKGLLVLPLMGLVRSQSPWVSRASQRFRSGARR